MTRLSCAVPVELRAGAYVARIAPAAGGRIASLSCEQGGELVQLLVPWEGGDFDAHHWPKAGAFPMLPFANRLPPDGFLFGERRVRPEPGPGGFALHGVSHRKPWDLLERSGEHARMRYVHEAGDESWPWAWSAWQDVRLTAQGLGVALCVRNESAEGMPLGMGWHPYHPAPRAVLPGDLDFRATARHDLDAQGQASARGVDAGFHMQRGETAAFSGWSASLRLRGASGGAIRVRTEGASGLVLHRPQQGDYLCAEPVTVLPGQLASAPLLRSGETRRLRWHCEYAFIEETR